MELFMVVGQIAGAASSTLFLGIVMLQARMYGVRTWVEYGLGTGKAVHGKPGNPTCVTTCEACPMRGTE